MDVDTYTALKGQRIQDTALKGQQIINIVPGYRPQRPTDSGYCPQRPTIRKILYLDTALKGHKFRIAPALKGQQIIKYRIRILPSKANEFRISPSKANKL